MPKPTLEAAASIPQPKDQKTLTNEPTKRATFKYQNRVTNSNQIRPIRALEKLRNENFKLMKIIAALEMSLNTFEEKFLNDDDNLCSICFGIFIRPTLLNCSHVFCEWCTDNWLAKHNYCPKCREPVKNDIFCLNMHNYFQKMMEMMPDKIKIPFKDLELSRAKDKPKNLEMRAERERLELLRLKLNGHIPF